MDHPEWCGETGVPTAGRGQCAGGDRRSVNVLKCMKVMGGGLYDCSDERGDGRDNGDEA